MKIYGFENYISKGKPILDSKKKWLWKPKNWDLIKNPKTLLKFSSTIEFYKKSNFKKGYVLILAKKNPNTGAILNELKKRNKPFMILDWDEFVGEGSVVYDQSRSVYHLRYKQHSFDLRKVKSIYTAYKEIEEVFYYQRGKFNNKEKVFLARWIETLRTLEFICNKAKWYPAKPSQMRFDSQNKFAELLQAQKIGFVIPKMIYTNEPREAQRFLYERKSLIKESGMKFFESGKKKLLFFTAKTVLPEDQKLSWVQTSPCMFQEYVQKSYDVRTIVVGNKILSCKIDSQKHLKANQDWRGSEHLVPFTPYKLPKDIEKKVLKFAQLMDFNMASFDIIKSTDGRFYFLEMNRPGHWFYIEILSGVPITKCLASQL